MTEALSAIGMLVMLYCALATYYAIIYRRQLLALQKKLEDYEAAIAFAQANDIGDAKDILEGN